MAQVELYGAGWCVYTLRARALLEDKNLEYRYIDVDATAGSRDEMQERGGGRTLPQVFIHGKPVGGCDDLHRLESEGRLDILLQSTGDRQPSSPQGDR